MFKCLNKNSLCPLDRCEKLSFVKDVNVYQQEIIFIMQGITKSLQHCDMFLSLRIRPWPPDFSFWPLHWNPVGVKNEPDYRGRWTRPGSSPQCWKLCFPSRQKRPGHGYWTFRSFLWKKYEMLWSLLKLFWINALICSDKHIHILSVYSVTGQRWLVLIAYF